MKEIRSALLTEVEFVKTRSPRGRSRHPCDFCHKAFRNKELRLVYHPPWKTFQWIRSLNFHQTCYLAYLHITALALFQEINDYGRNYKRHSSSKKNKK